MLTRGTLHDLVEVGEALWLVEQEVEVDGEGADALTTRGDIHPLAAGRSALAEGGPRLDVEPDLLVDLALGVVGADVVGAGVGGLHVGDAQGDVHLLGVLKDETLSDI